MTRLRSLASKVAQGKYSRKARIEQRLVAIEQRLAEIDGHLNHWIATIGDINHGVADIQTKLGEASADVEMAAALLMATERQRRAPGATEA